MGIWHRIGPGVNISDPGVSLGGLKEKTHGNLGIFPVKADILLEGVAFSSRGEWRTGPWDSVHIFDKEARSTQWEKENFFSK